MIEYLMSLFITQIINPFLNSRITANNDKVERHLATGKILIKGWKLYCKLTFIFISVYTIYSSTTIALI